MHRLKATAFNPNPSGAWCYFRDTQLLAPRPRAVVIPWGLIADQWREVNDAVTTVFAERMAAMADAEQGLLFDDD